MAAVIRFTSTNACSGDGLQIKGIYEFYNFIYVVFNFEFFQTEMLNGADCLKTCLWSSHMHMIHMIESKDNKIF